MIENTPDSRKSKRIIIRTLLFVASWVVTFVFGVLFCVGCIWYVTLLTSTEGVPTTIETSRYLVNYGILSVLTLTVVYLLVRKLKKVRFLKYASWALLIGIAINAIIFITSLSWLVSIHPQTSASVDQCTSLAQQLTVANGAVIPIETDLGSGTAFAVGPDGTYLTAYHVVNGAKSVNASLVSGKKPLTVQRTAPEYDIAVLKLDEPTPSYLRLTSKYIQADPVYAYGYPANAFTAGNPSLSSGLISRVLTNEHLKWTDEAIPSGLEMIQTDAAVNPGNSGGPLINKCGVVGVVSAVSDRNQLSDYGFVSEQGISYAISAKTISNRFGFKITE